MNNLFQFLRLNKESATPSHDSYTALLEMMKERIQVGHSRREPMVLTNTREVILERIGLLVEALHLEVRRDGWTVQNHRLLNHIKSVCWQLPDEAEAEQLEDILNGMTY